MPASAVQKKRRRRWGVVALGVLTVAAGVATTLALRNRQETPPAPREFPRLVPAPMTIAPGIHMLGGLAPSAAYAIETPEGLVLVDSGLDADAAAVKGQLEALHLDWKSIKAILLTHAHGDHCGGARHLREATGAKVFAGKGDADVLRAGGPREAFFSTYYMPDHFPHNTPVDVELVADQALDFGGVRIRALATPGHTPGSTCYLLERDGLRALFAGDVITMLRGDPEPHSELRKPLGTYSAYLAPRYRGDATTYLATLEKLRALPVPDLVLPGHPRAESAPQRPGLSQGRWEELLDRGIADMKELLRRYEADGPDFLDGEPKALLAGVHYLGDDRGRALYALAIDDGLVLVDAPGGPGLAEVVAARLKRLSQSFQPTAVALTSCDPEATAGLADLWERFRPRVFAPAAGIEAIKKALPSGAEVLPADQLAKETGLDVTTIPMKGRGHAPTAYHVRRAGKSILISGRIPIRPSQDAARGLFEDFLGGRGDVNDYLTSLNDLAEVEPALWLPAVPVDGQNANLYDRDWSRLISDNWALIDKNARALGR
jgi:glyoxylase-like metal-dependent hydrolase (beta-lactamase superfamily II)